MSTVAEKITYLNDTKSAIKNALVARGVSVSNSDTFRSYADKISEIGETVVVEKEITKYGASVNTLLGDVDENGVLRKPSDSPSCFLDLSTVRALENSVLYSKFSRLMNISGVDLSLLTNVENNGMRSAFEDCANLVDVNLSSLQTVGHLGLYMAFAYCRQLTSIDLSSLQSVGEEGLAYSFSGCENLADVNVSSLTEILNYSFSSCFSSCRSLTNVNLGSIQSVGLDGMNAVFSGCTSLVNVDLHSLVSVGLSGLAYAFSGCWALESVDLSSLTSVESCGLNGAFGYCSNLVSISFPALKNIQNDSLDSMTFSNCTSLTEIHFRADMQETIEATDGYSGKWGASNATVYFDLIGTITVDGVAYARDEKQSIRVDSVKTFVGWKDVNDNVVYTSYADNTEPAVGTVVYSDTGTTQVGTVEAVA